MKIPIREAFSFGGRPLFRFRYLSSILISNFLSSCVHFLIALLFFFCPVHGNFSLSFRLFVVVRATSFEMAFGKVSFDLCFAQPPSYPSLIV